VLELIRRATRSIDVCTFILATDGLGDEIAQAPARAGRARRQRCGS
jgi:hypothetical protein